MEKYPVQFKLGRKALEKLIYMKEIMVQKNLADVIRFSVSLTRMLVEEYVKGNKVLLQRKEGNKIITREIEFPKILKKRRKI